MGYESLHITELLSVQCLQVDDVIPILSPAVYILWFGRCGSQIFAQWHYGVYKFYSSCGFQQGDNIGITSSTCRHLTLSNSVMCSDSYPIPILSLFFLYHPYIPYFLIQRIFHFLVSFLFLLHACMYSHQVYNSNVGLAPGPVGWLFLFISTLLLCKGVSPSLCIVRLVVKVIVYQHVNACVHIGPSKSMCL